MKAISVIAVITLILALQSFAWKDTDFYMQHKSTWEKSRETTLAVANAMPEEKYDYTPDGEVRTFGAQILHLAYSNQFIIDVFLNGKQVKFEDLDAAKLSKKEIIKYLNESYDHVMEAMKKIKKSELNEMVNIGGGRQISKAEVFDFMRDHVTNHRAKANLYIRLNKIKPPAYAF
ncbi:MAG: DinB family protein [Calditrichaeota bacterium]|nr:DinB family protein [Calditrichota bacterium]